MFKTIYFAVLVASILLMGFFTFYSWAWLQSIGQPAVAVAGYDFHAGLAIPALWISFVILLVIGNVILWTTRNGWALWSSFGYLAVFIVIQYFWLNEALFHFKKDAGLWQGGFSVGPIVGAVMIVAAGIGTFFDHMLIVRLQRKVNPPTDVEAADGEALDED